MVIASSLLQPPAVHQQRAAHQALTGERVLKLRRLALRATRSQPAGRDGMNISDEDGGGRAESVGSVLTPGEESLTSDGSGPSRGPKRFCADHNGATRVHGVSARTTAEPPSRDLDGDARMSSGSEGSHSDSDAGPGPR